MSRVNAFNFSAVMLACFVGVWGGVKFFEPIIVEQLRKDGALRDDMQFAEYDEDGEMILPEGVQKPDVFKMLSGEQKLDDTTLSPTLQTKLADLKKEGTSTEPKEES